VSLRSSFVRGILLGAAAALCGCRDGYLQLDHERHIDPASFGAAYEPARFASADGTALSGLWFPAARLPAKGVVVQFHGNGENVTSHFVYVSWLALDGWDVLAFDYREFGDSEGGRSLKGSAADGVAALAYARAKAPGLPLVVIGQSMGAGLALAALDRDGGAGLRAIVLDSAFPSYERLARRKFPLLWLMAPLSPLLLPDSLSPDKLIARRARVPLLMLHAPGDPVVPYAEGRRLYELAPAPKEFWDVPGRGHTEAFGLRETKFRPRLLKFLDDALTPGRYK
jgi:fermentation-respiration switch protein FrsA (DUF1100 family)